MTMLDGVTGSGKTEVYLEAAATALAEADGVQVLILLPEIALTQAVIDRVAKRFGSAAGRMAFWRVAAAKAAAYGKTSPTVESGLSSARGRLFSCRSRN